MRIVHFLEHLPCGGIGTVVDMIHRATTAAGHDSQVISGGREAAWANWLPNARDWTVDLGFPKDNALFWGRGRRRRFCAALETQLRKMAPEVLHVHQIPTLIKLAPTLRRLKLPCVLTVHGMVPSYAGPGLSRFWIRRAFRRALAGSQCRGVAVSPSAARYVEKGLGLEPGQILFQCNPLDVDRFSGAKNSQSAPRTVFMLSRLIWLKRIQDGVRALALLDDKPEFRLRITGNGPMRAKLEALTEALSLKARVEFTGARKDIPEILHETGVLWHLSKTEGTPMAVLEAMAAGVPVVVADAPGSGELVQNEINGLVVPLRDPLAVATATRRLWSDEALRRRLIDGGRLTANEHRMERVGAEYVEHYRLAIATYR